MNPPPIIDPWVWNAVYVLLAILGINWGIKTMTGHGLHPIIQMLAVIGLGFYVQYRRREAE